jgi:hypothetical protein
MTWVHALARGCARCGKHRPPIAFEQSMSAMPTSVRNIYAVSCDQ